MAEAASADAPPRRRASWSLKSIVEDVAGKPIGDFQEPGRPVHPYLKVKGAEPSAAGARAAAPPEAPAEAYDPVGHLYPPLVGASARAYHGPEHEHHSETLAHHPSASPGLGEKPRASGPFHRPERLYLHYLLLHLDRLGDAALAYLRNAVEEEVAHRSGATVVPAAAPTPAVRPVPPSDATPPPLPAA